MVNHIYQNKYLKKLNIPLYHLDNIYWQENWEHLPKEEFINILNNIMNKDKWIIDGNYNSTLELRMKKSETIIFLDIDTSTCLESVKNRQGKKRSDLPSFLEEKEDEEFINFIKNFNNTCRINILNLLNKYNDKEIIILNSRNEINMFIKNTGGKYESIND